MTPSGSSLSALLAVYPPETIQAELSSLSNEQALELVYDWQFWARPLQSPPPEFEAGEKTYWLISAGRGFGKTRCGAEQVRAWARKHRYVNLIGPTLDDARDIMIEGESGILAICPRGERPRYVGRQLLWRNGCKSLIFTADEPERLRGKQHEKLWADEIGSWRYAQAAWDQAQFGLRLGKHPQAVVTSTPRPTPVFKSLIRDPSCVVTRGTSYENRANLSEVFYRTVVRRYEGTRLGRQELNAELLEDNPGALWTRRNIDSNRAQRAPETMQRIVVGVDPAVTSREDSDETGIVVVARAMFDQNLKATDEPHFFVLADNSLIATPDVWARAAVKAYHDHGADRIVAETNNGGEMVELTIRTVDSDVSYKAVHASRGKMIRAEPIAALYEQGRVHHVGALPALEDQLCDWDPLTSPFSPDRLDAMVWAATELSENDNTGMIEFYRQQVAGNTPAVAALPFTSQPRIVTGFAPAPKG